MGKRLANGTALHTLNRTNAAILAGEEDLTSWDDEEIFRGQRKAKNGRFVGRPPVVVPQQVHAERVRRTMSKAHQALRESTYKAVRLLETVVDDTDAPYTDRLRAAQLILERTLPKTNERVDLSLEVGAKPAFLALLEKATLSIVPGELDTDDEDDILDADVLGDDEITWEPDDKPQDRPFAVALPAVQAPRGLRPRVSRSRLA
ncbi:MAG: hypothetical protein AB7L17_16940 [Ilumatobacteraceae bacterium]